MYTTVSLYQLNALVAGNGSYIVRPCGHDLHGPTVVTGNEKYQLVCVIEVNRGGPEI